MARSESQGLQIAVILLTMCVVGLAVTTWVFYQSGDKEFNLRVAEEKKAKDANDRADKEAYKVLAYKHMMGDADATAEQVENMKGKTGGDPAVETALAEYKKLMALNPEAATPESKGLAKLPGYLAASLNDKNKDITASATTVTNVTREKETIEQREQGRAATAEQGMQKATADLAAERDAFNKQRADAKKKEDELLAQIAAKDKQLKDQKEKSQKEAADLNQLLVNAQTENGILKRKLANIKKEGPDYEAPDGEITWVNQRQRLAWIDVGYADGLTRQTTFSVYDHDENGVSSAKRKARIEVIRVDGPHLSECRILEDEIRNPILPGDKIFTPAWSPGQHLHFALNGMLDIDGDSRPDNDEIKRIIQLNGGVVDAELSPSGERTGTITSQTRYLIRGRAPSERELTADAGKKALADYSEMNEAAERSGTEIIDVSRFLGQMGWKAQERTTTLGSKRTGSKREIKSAPTETPMEPTETDSAKEPEAKPTEKPMAPADDNPFD